MPVTAMRNPVDLVATPCRAYGNALYAIGGAARRDAIVES
jgi:hypothetical protein